MTKKDILNYLSTHKEKFQKEYEVEQIGLLARPSSVGMHTRV